MPAKDNFELQLDLTEFSKASFVVKLGNSVAYQAQSILSLKNSKACPVVQNRGRCGRARSTVYRVV